MIWVRSYREKERDRERDREREREKEWERVRKRVRETEYLGGWAVGGHRINIAMVSSRVGAVKGGGYTSYNIHAMRDLHDQ